MPPKARLHQDKDKGKLKCIPKASTSSTVVLDQQSQQLFELELYWCIQQLQNGISSNKLNQKQLEDATKNLKLLTNQNTSVVQKRQVMRLTFGDYRKKMNDEQKKYDKVNQQNSLKILSPNKNSMFVKKSAFLQSDTNQFKFNFDNLQDSDSNTIVKLKTADADTEDDDDNNLNSNMINLQIHNTTNVTFQSDNSFRFNFDKDY